MSNTDPQPLRELLLPWLAQVGQRSPGLSNDHLSYTRVHWAARKLIGSACVKCGATGGRIEAALKPGTPTHKLLVSLDRDQLAFSRDPNDYEALCVLCHRAQDRPDTCRYGHPWKPETSGKDRRGFRTCLLCAREKSRAQRADPVTGPRIRATQAASKKRRSATQRERELELQRIRRARLPKRGPSPTEVNAAKTHCIRGHELAGDNLRVTRGGHRACRTCHRDRARAAYQMKKAAPTPTPYAGDGDDWTDEETA